MENIDPNRISNIVRRAVLECVAATRSEPASQDDPLQIFHSPKANQLKDEIVLAGKKLWEREYVDGNGGNISARISPHYVLCTPTLCGKGDLTPKDLSLVDLDNAQVCGDRQQTSEILLHLEIYKAVPAAKAVIHCHPPYATAHAIAGIAPQGNLIPEQEVFVGPLAVAPYETPGTLAFAQTVLPYVKDHNSILLTNHGIVCWADTVTHAEWYVEVVETYCKTAMIASQLRPKLNEIPPEKIADLLARKKGMGLPDPRLSGESDTIGAAKLPTSRTSPPQKNSGDANSNQCDVEQLIRSMTSEVLDFLHRKA